MAHSNAWWKRTNVWPTKCSADLALIHIAETKSSILEMIADVHFYPFPTRIQLLAHIFLLVSSLKYHHTTTPACMAVIQTQSFGNFYIRRNNYHLETWPREPESLTSYGQSSRCYFVFKYCRRCSRRARQVYQLQPDTRIRSSSQQQEGLRPIGPRGERHARSQTSFLLLTVG